MKKSKVLRRTPACFSTAFTLIELLTVMAIMALLIGLGLPSLQGVNKSGQFNGNISQIAGILDQARTYACAQNTYVWVAFYPLNPATSANDYSGDRLYVGVFASSDGTDPFAAGLAGAPPYSIPYTVSNTATTIRPILKLCSFNQLHLVTQDYFTQTQIPSLPTSLTNPTPPATTPVFALPLNNPAVILSAQPLPIGGQAPPISVIEFTPTGSVEIGSSLVASVGLDFQPVKSAGLMDTGNLAALRINGLTGLTAIYRK